jgi:hypothetical protein
LESIPEGIKRTQVDDKPKRKVFDREYKLAILERLEDYRDKRGAVGEFLRKEVLAHSEPVLLKILPRAGPSPIILVIARSTQIAPMKTLISNYRLSSSSLASPAAPDLRCKEKRQRRLRNSGAAGFSQYSFASAKDETVSVVKSLKSKNFLV